jgi:hypothetical protein
MALKERAATNGPEKGCFVKVIAKGEGILLTGKKSLEAGEKYPGK